MFVELEAGSSSFQTEMQCQQSLRFSSLLTARWSKPRLSVCSGRPCSSFWCDSRENRLEMVLRGEVQVVHLAAFTREFLDGIGQQQPQVATLSRIAEMRRRPERIPTP